LSTDGTFAGAALSASIKRPETLTLNFQTGIAEGTLLTASVHHAKWSAAPVTVDTVVNVADINETFDDSTKYSVGLARKLSNKWAISAGYSREEGGGSEASSLFTLSNGSQAFSLGARWSRWPKPKGILGDDSTLGQSRLCGIPDQQPRLERLRKNVLPPR